MSTNDDEGRASGPEESERVIVDEVLGHWDVTAVDVHRPRLGTMNEVFIIDSDRGRLALRGHRRTDREAIEFEHTVMDVARAGDVPAPRGLSTAAGNRVVGCGDRWWSLLVWIDGEQPDRGAHTLEQAASMGHILATIHDVLKSIEPPCVSTTPVETTSETIRRADALLSSIEGRSNAGDDEAAAIRWLTAQRDWLASHEPEAPPRPTNTQTIHGDFHDQNIAFADDAVVGVFDWDKADLGDPYEEVIRAMHLSFRLNPRTSRAFFNGYCARRTVTDNDLDKAARRYGYHRDRSLWFFDELYSHGNERLRPLLNHDRFVPFAVMWDAVRDQL